jgi:hypothetical protein
MTEGIFREPDRAEVLVLLAVPLDVAHAQDGSGITNITIGALNPASPFANGPNSVQATLSAGASAPNEDCEITITSWAWTWSASPGSCSPSTDTNQNTTSVWTWTQNPSLPGGSNGISLTVSVVLQGTNCSGSNFTTNYTVTTNVTVTIIQLTNECYATYPGNPTRTNIGIGEVVNLGIAGAPSGSTINWTVSGGGSLSVLTGTTNQYTAPILDPGNSCSPTIGATVTLSDGFSVATNLTFSVLTPTGLAFSLIRNINGGGQPPPTNRAGSESMFRVYVLPTSVSFYNVPMREDIAPDSITWPSGWVSNYDRVYYPFQQTYDDYFTPADDCMGPYCAPACLFTNGSYVSFPISTTVALEYVNAATNWVQWCTDTHYEFFNTNLQSQQQVRQGTNTATSGQWLGPWK